MTSCARPLQRFSQRVFRAFAFSLLVVSAVFTTYFVHAQKRRMEADLLDRGVALASLLAGGSRTAVYSENATLVVDALQGVLEREEVLSAAVFTKDRALLAGTGKTRELIAQSGELSARAGSLIGDGRLHTGCLTLTVAGNPEIYCPVLIRTATPTGQALFYETEPDGGQKELIGFVRITLDPRPLRREVGHLLTRSLLLVAGLLAVGTGAVFVLSRRVTGPLEQLTEAVRAFGAGGDVRPLPQATSDEIGKLAEAFAKMTRDLTEREREAERLAERLQNAQKMEAVARLGQGISHDFKNILSTLNAAVHILQKGSPDNEFVRKYAVKMQTSIDRARDLIERLVGFSRTRQIDLQPVDLTMLLRRLVSMLREAVGEEVRVHLEVPERALVIEGDAASLEQLVLNLAYNARDAMPDGGVLCVRLEREPGAFLDQPGVALLTIRDSGVGMAREVRRRLFEPFFTTKDVGSGMGLGLSIVHGIVEQHNGTIEVESEPGEGASFRLRLPLVGEDDVVRSAG